MSCYKHSNTVQACTCSSKKAKDLPHISLECCISCSTKGAIGSDIGFECEGSNNSEMVFWSYSHGSSSLLFMVKVIVLWLVSNSHEVLTAFVVVEISLQVSGYIFFAMSAFLFF